MLDYSIQAQKEATHTDDVGYLYKVITDENGNIVHVEYWDLRLTRWCQDLGTDFSYLIKIIENKACMVF